MSIIPITTEFRNVSVGPYVIDEFWVNEQGFQTTLSSSNVTLPGLYGRGTTILSCNLIAPGTGLNSVLPAGQTLTLFALNNLGGPSGTRVLYNALGTNTTICGTGLGGTLPADSWLTLQLNNSLANGATGNALGLAVKYTNLTQTQPRGYAGI
jgi:hypothetical protein